MCPQEEYKASDRGVRGSERIYVYTGDTKKGYMGFPRPHMGAQSRGGIGAHRDLWGLKGRGYIGSQMCVYGISKRDIWGLQGGYISTQVIYGGPKGENMGTWHYIGS